MHVSPLAAAENSAAFTPGPDGQLRTRHRGLDLQPAGEQPHPVFRRGGQLRCSTWSLWLRKRAARAGRRSFRLLLLGTLAGLGYNLDLGIGPVLLACGLLLVVYRCRRFSRRWPSWSPRFCPG